jgi:hypothetical protein
MFGKKYTKWGAVFPGNFVPVLKIGGKLQIEDKFGSPAGPMMQDGSSPKGQINAAPTWCQAGVRVTKESTKR